MIKKNNQKNFEKSKKNYIFAIGFLLLIFLLYLPKHPKINPAQTTSSLITSRVFQATQLFEQQPMQAVQELLQISKEYPDAFEPYYYLALASIQSGQYEKAMDRIKQAFTYCHEEVASEMLENLYLGFLQTAVQLKDEKPKETFEELLKNSVSSESLRQKIREIVTKLNLNT